MKAFAKRCSPFVAIAVALVLAACGGYTAVDLGGTVTGLTTNGLVLANGGGTVTIPANATSYKFPDQIGAHSDYAITIASQPAGLTCAVSNPTGTATGVAITWANVICTQNTYALGGTITGLTGTGLTLINGSSSTVAVDPGATSFVFPQRVADGAVYGVSVLAQPVGQHCDVSSGTDVIRSADVNSVQVNCN